MKNLKFKKVEVGVTLANQVKTTSSGLLTTKIKSTMKTQQVSNDMKNIKFSSHSIESFEFWLNRICFGRGNNPFRSTFNYVHSVKKAFTILKGDYNEIEGIKRVIDFKIAMVHLQDKLRYCIDQKEAYGIICAFSKYGEYVKWSQDNSANGAASVLVLLPNLPYRPGGAAISHRS